MAFALLPDAEIDRPATVIDEIVMRVFTTEASKLGAAAFETCRNHLPMILAEPFHIGAKRIILPVATGPCAKGNAAGKTIRHRGFSVR
jgi:hypothetical protein